MDNQNQPALDQTKVDEFKDAIKEGRWNDISSQVWGDKDAQRNFSAAARAGNLGEEGLPKAAISKEGDSIVFDFGGDNQIKF